MSQPASDSGARAKFVDYMKNLFTRTSIKSISITKLVLSLILVIYTVLANSQFSWVAFVGAFVIAASAILLVKYLRKAWWTGMLFGGAIASVILVVIYDTLRNNQSLTANLGSILLQTVFVVVLVTLLFLISIGKSTIASTGRVDRAAFDREVQRRIDAGELMETRYLSSEIDSEINERIDAGGLFTRLQVDEIIKDNRSKTARTAPLPKVDPDYDRIKTEHAALMSYLHMTNAVDAFETANPAIKLKRNGAKAPTPGRRS